MPVLETYEGYKLWHYIPSRSAAIAFIAVFAVLTVGHTCKMLRYKMWFCVPFVVGGVFEVIGYAVRAIVYTKTGELIPYVLQSVFLLLAPVLFAASLYMTLSRVICAVDGGDFSPIKPHRLTRIFVASDIVSFIIQASGASMKAQGKNSKINPNLGTYIVVGGLVFQLLVFGVFIVVTVIFNKRFRSSSGSSKHPGMSWQASLNMLYATSAMVMTRNVFRVIEYAMGNDGYLLSVEWGVYVFDAGLMSLTMACFFLWYPNQLKVVVQQVLKNRDGSSNNSGGIELLRK